MTEDVRTVVLWSLDHVSQNLVKTAFENGINMFDTAEGDRAGRAEVALYVRWSLVFGEPEPYLSCAADARSENWDIEEVT